MLDSPSMASLRMGLGQGAMGLGRWARISRESRKLGPSCPHKPLHISPGPRASTNVCMLGTAQSILSMLECREDDASAVCGSTFCLENA